MPAGPAWHPLPAASPAAPARRARPAAARRTLDPTLAAAAAVGVLLPQGDSDMEDYGFEYSGATRAGKGVPARLLPLPLAASLAGPRRPPAHCPGSPPPSPPPPPAADEEVEEQDVDVENQYYNSKGLLESEELEEALSGFRQVLKMEGEDKGEW